VVVAVVGNLVWLLTWRTANLPLLPTGDGDASYLGDISKLHAGLCGPRWIKCLGLGTGSGRKTITAIRKKNPINGYEIKRPYVRQWNFFIFIFFSIYQKYMWLYFFSKMSPFPRSFWG